MKNIRFDDGFIIFSKEITRSQAEIYVKLFHFQYVRIYVYKNKIQFNLKFVYKTIYFFSASTSTYSPRNLDEMEKIVRQKTFCMHYHFVQMMYDLSTSHFPRARFSETSFFFCVPKINGTFSNI